MLPSRRSPALRSPALAALVLAVSLLAGCGGGSKRPAPAARAPMFEDVTAAAGINYQGDSYGAAWGDFNGDGLPDIWATGHSPITIYVNQGDGTFENLGYSVVHGAGTDWHAASWADIDRDGDQDLLQLSGAEVGQGKNTNCLFYNEDGILVDRAADVGFGFALGRGRTPAWVDLDGDGWLDAVVNNAERQGAPTQLMHQFGNRFEDVTAARGLTVKSSDFSLLFPLGSPPSLHLFFGATLPGPVYSISEQRMAGTLGPENEKRWITDAVFVDVDNDLDLDFVNVAGTVRPCSALMSPTELRVRLKVIDELPEVRFETEGEVTFDVRTVRPVDWTAANIRIGAGGVNPPALNFTLSAEDPASRGMPADDPTGQPGALVGFDPELGAWRFRLAARPDDSFAVTIRTHSPIVNIVRIGHEDFSTWHVMHLLLNEDGKFVDASKRVRIGEKVNGFSIAAGDFDNDMDVDLYVERSAWVINQENRLLLNRGDGWFDSLGTAGAPGTSLGNGDTATTGDYDVDGFLDLFLTNGYVGGAPEAPHELYRNRGNKNHWLEIDLVGTTSNRDGIGARVLLRAGGVEQMRFQDNGTHNRAQNSKRLHFGLGQNTRAERIVVEWPSGVRQELLDVEADRVIAITEP